ncbi:MAG: ribosome assembly RNA-binding protein YhbY [Sedimenticolaceae bacterium]|nr:ribosome assembly RNA-binding protein YhbY [Sedimenticolaceae bacterium]
MSLTAAQKRFLRSRAHHLKPVVMVGQHGLNENILTEVGIALDAHELIKVKIAAERDERAAITQAIVEHSGAELVQTIGQMSVLYRRNEKKPKIQLPKE